MDTSKVDLTQQVTAFMRAETKAQGEEALRIIDRANKINNIDDPLKSMDYMAKNQLPYTDSYLQQNFSCIKDIRHHKGAILVLVDEVESRRVAADKAFRKFGTTGNPIEIMKYMEQHTYTDTLMSVPKFENRLRIVLMMAGETPEYFGQGTGGGPLKDIYQAAVRAIVAAKRYLAKHKDDIPDDVFNKLTSRDTLVTDHKIFQQLIGDTWEEEIKHEQMQNMKSLLFKGKII